MVSDTGDIERVARMLRERAIDFLDLQFIDVVGAVKGVTIPVADPLAALTRLVRVDGSSLEGSARFAETDMYLRPDISTLAVLPSSDRRREADTARVICDVLTPSGEPFSADPRQVLRRALAGAEQHGLSYRVAPEVEFFLYQRDDGAAPRRVVRDAAGYFDLPISLCARVVDGIMTAAQAAGLRVAAAHHEIAPSQYEIDLSMGDALALADAIITLKAVARRVAQHHGLAVTFMPKPFAGCAGSGMHIHQMPCDARDGGGIVDDPDGEYALSERARRFIAGQLAHARGLCAVLAPLANSYKRLIHGYEAPVHVVWARINHAALLRVARGASDASTLELRCLDGGANPYLAFAAMLRAGLDGIEAAMEPPPPVEEPLHGLARRRLDELGVGMLPASLDEALQELEWDPIVRDALGPEVYDIFMAAKALEWDDYRRQLTPWELDRYHDV